MPLEPWSNEEYFRNYYQTHSLFCSIISLLLCKLQQWSLYEVAEDILHFFKTKNSTWGMRCLRIFFCYIWLNTNQELSQKKYAIVFIAQEPYISPRPLCIHSLSHIRPLHCCSWHEMRNEGTKMQRIFLNLEMLHFTI